MSTPQLLCENLSVQYFDRDEPTLKKINLTINQGESVLFLGPSGCGKSTLLYTLSGIIPRSIHAWIKGNVKAPQNVGTLFQDPDSQFCMLEIADEIAFSLENKAIPPEKMPDRIASLKKQMDLDHLPDHTQINTLSGGLKQRLALAAVLAMEPEVLFCDEPTAQLDPAGTRQILNDLSQLKGKHTLVLVEHKLDGLMDWIDRVILFSPEGKIIDEGAPLPLFRRNETAITRYGIWKPKLWPATWESIIKGKHPEKVEQWKPLPKSSPTEKEPLLTLSEGALYHRKDKALWQKVNLTVYPGEWVVLLGPNGAGKSSLLQTLIGIHSLSSGKLSYSFTQSDKELKPEILSQHIGFVFQNPEHQFITDRVEDEVAFIGKLEKWPEKEITEKVEKLLYDFRLLPLREANPYTLSVGQKRRLSVASMLLKEYKLLLLDEPTFGQDATTTEELLERLEILRQRGTAIIMATHDVELAYRHATKAAVLAEGQLLFSGPPEELFTHTEILKQARLERPLYLEYQHRRNFG